MLFRSARLAASTALVASSYRGASTIHVLTLNSENAGQELAGLLEAPAFFREEKQLYIIKKEGNPVSYFVFYGIFDTPETGLGKELDLARMSQLKGRIACGLQTGQIGAPGFQTGLLHERRQGEAQFGAAQQAA